MILPALPARLRSLFPNGWTAASDTLAPLAAALFAGLAEPFVWVQQRQAYAVAQTRIATASTFWLDLIAWDFFGPRFLRRPAEPDDPFRFRIIAELFRPRNTRDAISQALTDLTGTPPQIVELWNTNDCGAYDTGTMAYASADGTVGVGAYGSYDFPNQMLITAHRGVVVAELNGNAGYGTPYLAYGGAGSPGQGFYVSGEITTAATDDEINATIAATVAGGCIGWVQIEN